MTKLLQFLFINLRTDKDSGSADKKSNQNLKKNIADQAEHIKVPEVIKNSHLSLLRTVHKISNLTVMKLSTD